MDILEIQSEMVKKGIAAGIKRFIRKKYGIDVEIRFTDDIKLKIDNGAHLAISAEADISKNDLAIIEKKIIGF